MKAGILPFLLAAAFLASPLAAQPEDFPIGAYAVHNTPHALDTHRISAADEMDDGAWDKLHELGITLPFFTIRADRVDRNFPRTLWEAARAHGFPIGLVDDSLVSWSHHERRIYQAEDPADFSLRGTGASTAYVSAYAGGDDFDLSAPLRAQGWKKENVLLLPKSPSGRQMALAGFKRTREWYINRLYFLSARVALRSAPDPPVDTNAILMTVILTAGSDSLVAHIRARNFLPDTTAMREIFLGYFRPVALDSATYGLHWHGTGGGWPTYDTLLREPDRRYTEMKLTRRNSAIAGGSLHTLSADPGPEDFAIRVIHYGIAGIALDQINVSDEQAFACFTGDEHCLPEHRKSAGGVRTPLDARLRDHLRLLLDTAGEGDVRFLQLHEAWFDAGTLPLHRYIALRVKEISASPAATLSFHNQYFATNDGSADDFERIVRQNTEGAPSWSGLYGYPITYEMPKPAFDSARYYQNHYIYSNSTYPVLSTCFNFNEDARVEFRQRWLPAIGSLSWAFADGHVNYPPDKSLEQREPNAAEMRLQTYLTLCYGARGILYYGYNSFKGNGYPYGTGAAQDTTAPPPAGSSDTLRMGAVGFLDYNLTKRSRDVHGENKWDSTRALNRKLLEMGKLLAPLMPVDGGSYDLHSPPSVPLPVSWIYAQRLGVRPDSPQRNRYVEVGSFTTTPASDTIFLLVVNKRTDPLGARHITLKLQGSTGSVRWRMTNLLTGRTEIVDGFGDKQDNTLGGFTDYFPPGDAWLYRAVPLKEALPPTRFYLFQNAPNPSSSTTRIDFLLPAAAHLRLELFDLLGRRVAEIAARRYDAGIPSVPMDLTGIRSGVYYYRLSGIREDGGGKFDAARKMLIVK